MMANDRFVYFSSPPPTREHVQWALEDYVRGIGKVEWNSRFFVTLPGLPSNPAERLSDVLDARYEVQSERWFEVCLGNDNLDVITRMQDAVTSAIADGFASFAARFWKGRRDHEKGMP